MQRWRLTATGAAPVSRMLEIVRYPLKEILHPDSLEIHVIVMRSCRKPRRYCHLETLVNAIEAAVQATVIAPGNESVHVSRCQKQKSPVYLTRPLLRLSLPQLSPET